jgi:AbrB family looped-hinge helix DNA binding protein
MTDPFSSCFHGVATVGEKGQVVIPASARKALELETGEKLLVFGMGDGTVMLCKVSEIAKLSAAFGHRLAVMKGALEIVGDQVEPAAPTKGRSKGKNHERSADRNR